MGDVIYLDQIRRRKQLDHGQTSMHSKLSKYKTSIYVDPSRGQNVQIYNFDPNDSDELCIYRLVYNQPSVLDSYYAMYPDQVIVVRYIECAIVCIRSKHDMSSIIDVVKHGDWWYSKVTDNVDT